MAAIKVLVVADGPFPNTPSSNSPIPYDGISFAPSQNPLDTTFTISEFLWLIQNNNSISISVDTAHRRNDTNAKFPNFNFQTTISDLSQYDVIWLFGYEGYNDGQTPNQYPAGQESAITGPEVQAIQQFMDGNGGGGVFATGDHAGLGSYLCGQIPRVSSMRKWFGRSGDVPVSEGYPTQAVNYAGMPVSTVNWAASGNTPPPNGTARADTLQKNTYVHVGVEAAYNDTDTMFYFDDQSDNIPMMLDFPQPMSGAPGGVPHPILQGRNGPINRFPDHMHEGEVVTPLNLQNPLTINGASYQPEYPTNNNGFTPAPSIIATTTTNTSSVSNVGHSVTVASTGEIIAGTGDASFLGSPCEQFFTGDMTASLSTTIGVLCAYDGRGVNVGRIVTDSSFHHYLDLNLI